MNMASSHDRLQQLYVATATDVRPSFLESHAAARVYYERYVRFVVEHVGVRPARILDIGCGAGWSTALMRESGHDAQGLDLCGPAQVEARAMYPDLPYTQGDAQHIPFAENSFDIVSMHQVLEHVPDPEAALRECLRVLKPGGRIVIVGPNLTSFVTTGYWAIKHTIRCLRSGQFWEQRVAGMPRHPGGNTMPEAWRATVRFMGLTASKLLGGERVVFEMREPDEVPPFFSDNDACYLCTPIDLVNWARRSSNARPLRWWSLDRLGSRLSWPIAGGTWVVIEKTP